MKKKTKDKLPEGARLIARNKRALRDYDITERFEAGLVLTGSEVKSLRAGNVTLTDAYAILQKGEVWLVNMQIKEYPWANQFNHEPTRLRKLLLHRQEINKLDIKVNQKSLTLVALSLYFKGSRVKVEIGVGRGRKQFEKREVSKTATAKREIDQELKRRSKY